MQRQAIMNINMSKYSIIRSALLEIISYFKKLILDYGKNIELIIVAFDDMTKIYSTIDLKHENNIIIKGETLDKIENIIKYIVPSNGTDFSSVHSTNLLLNQYLSNYDNYKIIKYIMSDGCHMNISKWSRDMILSKDEQEYDYTLGIGNKSCDYDEELLKHLGKTFINGDMKEKIIDSIIGDTYDSINTFAKDVNISIITTDEKLLSSLKIINTEIYNDNIILDENNSPFKLESYISENIQTIKIMSNEQKPVKINKKIVIFYVDKSESMNHPIYQNDISCSQINDTVLADDELNECSVDSIISEKRYRDDENVLTYYKHTLETISNFNYTSEIFMNISDTNNVFIELNYIIDSIQYNKICKCIKTDNMNDIDIIKKCCYLRSRLNLLPNMKNKKKILIHLLELIKSPDYNKIVKSTNNSSTKIIFIGMIDTIRNIAKANLPISDQLFNDMISTFDTDMIRTISCTQTRTYTTQETQGYKYEDDINLCIICKTNQREVIYDCNHCIICKQCTKKIFFHIDEELETNKDYIMPINLSSIWKKCPICNKEIKTVRIIYLFDNKFKCCAEDCENVARYISNNCDHLTYCSICIRNNKYCKCGVEITSKRKIYI